MMALEQTVQLIIKIAIVMESMMLATSLVGYYFLLTSSIKNGLHKALATVFITGMIYSLMILASLFLVSSDYEQLYQYSTFSLLVIIFFISRTAVLGARLYLAHELRSTVIKQTGKKIL